MKKTLIIILTFYSILTHGQDLIDIYGAVSICNLTRGSIKIFKKNNDSTNSSIVDVYEIKSGKVHTDKLIANVKIFRSDSLIFDLTTDSLGRFELKDIKKETLDFKIRINQYLKHDYKMSWGEVNKKQRITFCISDSLYNIKTDSIIYSMIPYDSFKAEEDIKNGNIYYLQLITGDSFLENSDFEYLEQRFGFKYLYDDLQFPSAYLLKAQYNYNKVVFKHLDNKCKCDFKSAYDKKIKRIIFDRLKKDE